METAVGTPLTGSGAQELESWVQIPALQTSRLNASYKKKGAFNAGYKRGNPRALVSEQVSGREFYISCHAICAQEGQMATPAGT